MLNAFCHSFLLLVLFVGFGFGCKDTAGETLQNAYTVDSRDFVVSNQLELPYSFLKIKGVAVTALFTYTFKKGTRGTLEHAENFYFPVIPIDFNPRGNKLAIFASCTPRAFQKLTNNFTYFTNIQVLSSLVNPSEKVEIQLLKEDRFLTGQQLFTKEAVPADVLSIFERDVESGGFGLSLSDKRITLKLIKVESAPILLEHITEP